MQTAKQKDGSGPKTNEANGEHCDHVELFGYREDPLIEANDGDLDAGGENEVGELIGEEYLGRLASHNELNSFEYIP